MALIELGQKTAVVQPSNLPTQIIGASRETATRLFVDFKKKQLLQIKGSTLIVRNKAGLESLSGS